MDYSHVLQPCTMAIDQGSRLAAEIESASPEGVGELVAPLGFSGWLFQKVAAARGGNK